MDNKEKFCMEYQTHITRPGSEEFLNWLLATDFFTAPASTKFHGAYEGGLVEHSLNVFYRLQNLLSFGDYGAREKSDKRMETIAICGLLHDICKANFYTISMRNVKNEKTKVWEQQPYYTVADQFPYGHGEKSVYIINTFFRLSRDEALAIRWHMGGFDDAAKGFALTQAYENCPLAPILHMADMMATYLDEGMAAAEPKNMER